MRYRFLRFPGGKFKAVTFSYDDGCRADLRLADILTAHGLKGTFNINTSGFGNSTHKLQPDELRASMLDRGHELAVHGHSHIAPGIADPTVAIYDALECRRKLESTFSMIIRGMAYPDSGITRMHNGNSYENIRGFLSNLGIVYSRSLAADNNSFHIPEDFLAWIPTAHHKNGNLFPWAESFVTLKEETLRSANRYPRLFYLWGHAYEFDNDNNWDRIEQFCDLVGGKDDTWYATNIEICEYVLAFRSLVTSADGCRIYNPTLFEIFMDIDGTPYSIKPGETIVVK